MFIRKHLTVILFCFLFLTNNLFSQIFIQGIVTDNGAEFLGNGSEPVENALVIVTDQADTNRSFSAYTDAQGHYEIQIQETVVDDIHIQNPGAFNLIQNYPNPFNPSTIIAYELLKPANISITIYNVLGQKIKTVFDGFQNDLTGHFVWDATDDLGQGVSAGVYIYSLKAEGIRINRKMLLLDGHQGNVNVTLSQSKRTDFSSLPVLNKQSSDQYILRITGDDIETYEQQDLEITENMTLDITVIRTVTDIDGNVYRTVKIDDQWWMAENLKVTHYQNGNEIHNVTDDVEWSTLSTGAYQNYDNNEDNVDTYGRLYNWHALNDSRNIAPEGWQVPTDEEWKELEMALGMSQEAADGTGFRGIDIGGKLKETGITHWEDPNTGATNESGFSARPGGYCGSGGIFNNIGNEACFWSSTEGNSSSAWFRALQCDHSYVNRNTLDKRYGFSVRCVKGSDNLIESIETLGDADSIYQSVYASQGREAAVDSTITFLNSQALVSSAGMSPDSSVYVFYTNGLQGCVYNPELDTTATSTLGSDLKKGVQHLAGGEATPMAVILLPFANHLGSESEEDVKTSLDYCFGGSAPKTEIYRNGLVDVPIVKDWLQAGPGVLFWFGHGCMARIEPGLNEYWTAFVTGESYTSRKIAEEVRDYYEEEAFSQGVMREIIIAIVKGRFYLAVTPAFVSHYANFDVISDINDNCNKSVVFACCCSSANVDMADAFLNGGVDAYLGWSKTVHANFARYMHTAFFQLAAEDTCTIKEAYELIRYNLDPTEPHAELVLDISDTSMMIRAQMNMSKDGIDLHGYSVGVTILTDPPPGVTTVGCWTEPGLAGICNINVSFPGTNPGSFNCASDDNAVISLMDASAGKMYIVQAGLVGVQGTINIDRYDGNMVYGTFSGTLGYWEQGQSPKKDPPSETVNIQKGFIKHTGLRLQL